MLSLRKDWAHVHELSRTCKQNIKRPRDDANHITEYFDPNQECDEDDDDWHGHDYNDGTPYLVDEEDAMVAVEKNPMYRGCTIIDSGCS